MHISLDYLSLSTKSLISCLFMHVIFLRQNPIILKIFYCKISDLYIIFSLFLNKTLHLPHKRSLNSYLQEEYNKLSIELLLKKMIIINSTFSFEGIELLQKISIFSLSNLKHVKYSIHFLETY